jgi:hypothetical protein
MSLSRLAVLVPVVAIAGCYSDAAPESTLPVQRYVSGPPGGGMAARDPRDPGSPPYSALANGPAWQSPPPSVNQGPGPGPADEADDDEDEGDGDDADPRPPAGPVDPASGGAEVVGGIGGPGGPGAPPALPPGGPSAIPPGAVAIGAMPSDPTSRVGDAEIDAALGGYGQWIDTDDYGQIWRPDATQVGVDFTPYESGGSWEYTDAGWAFAAEYPWGWLPFHYGRWGWFHDYWGWVPGHRWGAAWVDWRNGGGVVGWRPTPPGLRGHRGTTVVRDHRHGEGPVVRDARPAQLHDAHWRFATANDFGRPHVRSHLYGDLAEGLRVTRPGAVPPRARTAIRATDLMRNRFASPVRPARAPIGRAYGPVRSPGYDRGPGRAYGSPGYRGSAQAPGRGYPGQGSSSGGYSSGGNVWAPGRSYAPPRGYPDRGYAPPRSYRPSGGPSGAWSRPTFGGHSGGSSFGGGSHSSGGGSSSGGSHGSTGAHSGGRR